MREYWSDRSCNLVLYEIQMDPVTGEQRRFQQKHFRNRDLNAYNNCPNFKRKFFAPKTEMVTPTKRLIYCKNCRYWK
jgi:hypothetical protein